MRVKHCLLGLAALILGACASVPTGPSAMALPGTGRNFNEFRSDDQMCRRYALDSIGGSSAADAQIASGTKSAAVGALVGAAIGAAVNGGRGAGVGAGTGLAVGALSGSGAAAASASDAQRRYDQGYLQCMYAQGHRIPVYGRFTENQAQRLTPPPPPPPGTPRG